VALPGSHCPTGEDEPWANLSLTSDAHTLDETILPELSRLGVVGVPVVVDPPAKVGKFLAVGRCEEGRRNF